MVYEYIKKNYQAAEPIFFSDLRMNGISKSAINQQLKKLCESGQLVKYDTGIYYMPKKGLLNSSIGPSADVVAKYKYIIRNGKIDGYFTGNTFANQLGISTQVPRIVEIVSNNTNSSPRVVQIGKRSFYVKQPVEPITKENVFVLQMLDLLKNLDTYLDYDYTTARERFSVFIEKYHITRVDVDRYIRKYPSSIFRYYYELELDHVLTH